MNYDKKDDPQFEQYLNLSGSSSNLNSPITTQPPPGGFFGLYSQQQQQQQQQQPHIGRAVPGFKNDYNLKKASSKSDLRLQEQDILVPQTQAQTQVPYIQQHQQQQQQQQLPQQLPQPHISQEDVTLFLDELNSLNSPSNVLNFNHQFDSGKGSPQYMNAPMIISTPPQEDNIPSTSHSNSSHNLMDQQQQTSHLNTHNQIDLTMDHVNHMNHLNHTSHLNLGLDINGNSGYNDFLQPDFQGAAFQQQRFPQTGALSDLASSVSNSPFINPYSPSQYEDDLISNAGHDFLDYGLPAVPMDSHLNGNGDNEVDLLSAELDMRLTEANLHQATTQSPVTISISTAPEDPPVHKTPSLFSSNRSSRTNTPNHSRAGSNSSQLKSGHLAQSLKADNMSGYTSAVDDSDLLKPDDMLHSQMRAGRQRRQSRSRSRSTSRERDRSQSTNREKMLELASPNAPNKRTQKHPSIYACHLCEKRFTRPYNLKSHLRTHTDDRPFVCTVCGKAFARQHDRKRHEDLHSGQKRFECQGTLRDGVTPWGCGKKFARTDALGRHFKTEAGKECIRPLVEEHENELRQRAAADGTQFTAFDMNALPEQLYTQFPELMHPSQNNSGVSDLSDIE